MALQLKMDPTGIEAGAAKAKAALSTVTGEAVKTENAIEAIGKTGAASVAPVTQAATAIESVGIKSGATTGMARMLGQQLSQVAQQGAVTGNYLGALATQLPDMALGFGNIAIAGSILATVAMPLLIQALGNGKSAAENLLDAEDRLGASIQSLKQITAEFANGDLETLRKKYGEVDASLLQLIEHQRQEQIIGARNAAKDAIKALADEYRITTNAISVFAATGRGDLAGVSKELNLSKNATIGFAMALKDAQNATTFEAQAAALAKVDVYLQRSSINGSELANGVTEAALQLREASAQTKVLDTAIQSASTAMATLAATQPGAGWLGVAIGRAQTLASTLWGAAQAAAAAQGAEAAARGAQGYGGRPEGDANSTAARQAAIIARQQIEANRIASAGGGGGGGGGDSVAAQLTDAQKAQIALNDAIAKGTDAYGQFQSAAGNAIDKLISGTGNLKSALRDMAKEMALALIQGQLLAHVTGGTAGMSIGQLLVKGLFGGFHDAGGTIPMGTTGVVGERGPELVTAGAGGAMVTSRVDTARMMQSAPQNLHITVGVSVDDGGKLKAFVQNVAQSAGSQAVQTVKRSLNGWNNQLQTDGALA